MATPIHQRIDRITSAFPEIEVRSASVVDTGWDTLVVEVNGEIVFRFPRRSAVRAWLLREIALLRKLGPRLPVAVPRYEYVAPDGSFAGYRKIEGRRIDEVHGVDHLELGRTFGRFLSALHASRVTDARDAGLTRVTPADTAERCTVLIEKLRPHVLPTLTRSERAAVDAMLERSATLASRWTPMVVHADLGPAHILCGAGTISGIIDWSEAEIGDPAIDLAWALHGSDRAFATGTIECYPRASDREVRERTLLYHMLGPWHEVLYGLETNHQSFVESGLAGIRARLSLATDE